jgi:hypothetical protein
VVVKLDGFEEVLEAGFLLDRFHREVGAVHQCLLGSRPQRVKDGGGVKLAIVPANWRENRVRCEKAC